MADRTVEITLPEDAADYLEGIAHGQGIDLAALCAKICAEVKRHSLSAGTLEIAGDISNIFPPAEDTHTPAPSDQ